MLRTFAEKIDTGFHPKKTDTSATKKATITKSDKDKKEQKDDVVKDKGKSKAKDTAMKCTVNIDTSNAEKRTFDFAHKQIRLTFNKKPELNAGRITLIENETGIALSVRVEVDTQKRNEYVIHAKLQENMMYMLKLAKGFAKDSLGNELMPARYKFRTFEEDDYGKIRLLIRHLNPDTQFVLRVDADKDSVYQATIADSVVMLNHLLPSKYSFRIIVDANRDSTWTTGDLFLHRQPEMVLPHFETVNLKAGWEQDVDFNTSLPVKEIKLKSNGEPKKSDEPEKIKK